MSRTSAQATFMIVPDPSAADVSAAVIAVLRDMAVVAPPGRGQPAFQFDGRTEFARSPIETHAADDSIVAYPGKLLLERHAVSLPDSTRQIVTSPATVVTPLAREILRKRGVAVRISNAAGLGSPSPVVAGEWAVLRLCESPQAHSLEAMLIGRGGEGWLGFGAATDAAVSWLETQPAGHLAVLAQSAAYALWRLIRHGVRAAQLQASGDVERIVTTFAPQCLVVEPTRLAIHESRQIFRAWRAMGVHVPGPESNQSFNFAKEPWS